MIDNVRYVTSCKEELCDLENKMEKFADNYNIQGIGQIWKLVGQLKMPWIIKF